MGRAAGEVHPSTPQFDEEQDIQPLEPDGVGGELPVVPQLLLNALVRHIRIVARPQAGTRLTINRSIVFRGTGSWREPPSLVVMPPSASDTAHDSGPARYPVGCMNPLTPRERTRG